VAGTSAVRVGLEQQWPDQAEGQTLFRRKFHVLFAESVTGCGDGRPALLDRASPHRATLDEETRALHEKWFAVDRDRGQSQPKISRIVQSVCGLRLYNSSGRRRSQRRYGLAADHDGLVEYRREGIAGVRC
jgi:hypothetical protein